MECIEILLGICLVEPSKISPTIFGFAEFISAFAMLVIVYTVTDIRYIFRLSVAPLALFKLTFLLLGFIGIGTLLSEIWISQRWLVPQSLISQAIWQGMFGLFFILLAMTWLYYAFINPPTFSQGNYERYARNLFRIILRGSESELPVIANEVARSAESLVKASSLQNKEKKAFDDEECDNRQKITRYADSIFSVLANRKICRHIVESTPVTAIAIFEEAKKSRFRLPLGQFALNIASEAFNNKDSILYHEDGGYYSGLIGELKHFRQAVFGEYMLVEGLNPTPLDTRYEVHDKWDAEQFEAYTECVLLTLRSYVKTAGVTVHSYALVRAFEVIKYSVSGTSTLHESTTPLHESDAYWKIHRASQFITDALDIIGKGDTSRLQVRVKDPILHGSILDHLAGLAFEIIHSAAYVRAPGDLCWEVQYNAVWSKLFRFHDNKIEAWKLFHSKLRRLLYNEIKEMDVWPNYKGARILGFCINVMGVKIHESISIEKDYLPLQKAVLSWVKKNYLALRKSHPEVADYCLMGRVTFNKRTSSLEKAYIKSMDGKTPKDVLQLKPLNQ